MKSSNNIWMQKNGPLSDELALDLVSEDLGKLPRRLIPDKIINSVCGFCSTGCSLSVHMKGNQPVNLTPNRNYPVNLGEACPKGWESLTPLKASDRATTPYLRDKNGRFIKVNWDTALSFFVSRFKAIQQKYGPESLAFLSTGQICTEEMAFLGALAKFGMGILHGDGNTRQCMATSVVSYKEAFGFDAPPFTYQDFEESDCVIFIGANPCIAHPIMWQRVCRNKNEPLIIVVDPRKTETAMAATHHYAIQPKSDLVLLYGLAYILIKKGWVDETYIKNHTQGFEAFRQHVRVFTPMFVSRQTGLSKEDLCDFAAMIHYGRRVSFWWTMGVNQSYEGVRTAQAIINLCLMTGNIGRPGTGPNSITGQCNAMGSRLFSNTTNLLGGHSFLKEADRRKIAQILGIDVNLIPTQESLAYDQIIDQIAVGKIKGLWVIATNPAHSWIDQKEVRGILGNLDFLVVQDMYTTTQTAKMADLILPAAGWGEKEGTVINSERRIGLFRKAARPPGDALSDFEIFKLIAQYWGCSGLFKEWNTPEDVFQSMKKISRGTPCDITGIKNYAMLEEYGGIQWPFPEGERLKDNQRRLFEDGKFFHDNKKARFIFEDPKENPEKPDHKYPFILLTGRGTSAQWHTQTRTEKSPVLRTMYPPEVYVEVNPNDAQALALHDQQWIYVTSRRAQIKARAFVVPSVQPGQVFIPMHYEETNRLTFSLVDPYSRQPSYKICAVQLSVKPYYP